MSNRTTPTGKRNASKNPKPEKPYPGFPLFAHGSGQWAKKIKKRLAYFGSWREDPDGTAAMERFNREWPYLKEGRQPPPANVSADGVTLRELANDFLANKEVKLKAGELSPLSFGDYFRTCEGLVDHFGKERRVDDLRPDDFRKFRAKLAKRFSAVRLRNEINRVAILFNYAFENELIEKPVRYGQEFSRPSAMQLRRHRNQAGPKLFEREEVLRLVEAADVHLRAMMHLGANCGFGNTDVATLPRSAVDLESGWINFPRPKTEIDRRIPLWPETVKALRESFSKRPEPADDSDAGLFFLTRFGVPWVRMKAKTDGTPGTLISSVCLQFGKLRKELGIDGRRGFYGLRHTFETVAGESKDQVAVDAIMGHVDASMAANYRHRISDERLRAVVDTVRTWLFPPEDDAQADGDEAGERGGAA